MGPYLCYRMYTDDKIRIRSFKKEEDTPPGSEEELKVQLTTSVTENYVGVSGKEKIISLKPILINKEDNKFLTFARIPLNSFLTIRG